MVKKMKSLGFSDKIVVEDDKRHCSSQCPHLVSILGEKSCDLFDDFLTRDASGLKRCEDCRSSFHS